MNFRRECVSGCGSVYVVQQDGIPEPSSVWIYVTNRGRTEEVARVILNVEDNPRNPMYDSGDKAIAPGGFWAFEFHPADTNQLGLYWGRILTTSANLVSTMRILNPQFGDTPPHEAYFAPGDFAVLTLPFRVVPPTPPIGPVGVE